MSRVYVFDMDGTLADSMTDVWGVLPLKFLDDRKIAYPEDLLKRIIALGVPGLIRYYQKELGVVESPREIYEWFLENGRGMYATSIEAKPFVKEKLLALKAQGASLHILTGSPHAFLDPWVKRVGIETLFDNLWSVDDFPVNKSNPQIYKQIAERLGVDASECVMIDDSFSPLEAARAAGWKTVAVYEKVATSTQEEMRNIADRYVFSFEEL